MVCISWINGIISLIAVFTLSRVKGGKELLKYPFILLLITILVIIAFVRFNC